MLENSNLDNASKLGNMAAQEEEDTSSLQINLLVSGCVRAYIEMPSEIVSTIFDFSRQITVPNVNEYFFKVIILGPAASGKTCVGAQFCGDEVPKDYKPTIGADFLTKEVAVKVDLFTRQTVLAQLWDTTGQERLRAFAVPFYRESDAVIYVLDVTEKDSLEQLDKSRAAFLQECDTTDSPEDIPSVLLANKCDLLSEQPRQVSSNDAREYAESNGMVFYDNVSAKTGANVEAAIHGLLLKTLQIHGIC